MSILLYLRLEVKPILPRCLRCLCESSGLMWVAAASASLPMAPPHTITEEEHRQWHEQHKGGELTPQEHAKLMRRLGAGRKDDRKWHKTHGTPEIESPAEKGADDEPVSVFAIGGRVGGFPVPTEAAGADAWKSLFPPRAARTVRIRADQEGHRRRASSYRISPDQVRPQSPDRLLVRPRRPP